MPKFTWNIDPVAVYVGSFEVRYYSLFFVAVFLGGYALLNWQIRRGGGDEEAAGDFIVYGVLGVLIGSRLGHVLFYDLDKALQDPLWVLKIWTGGLASHGAVAGLILAMYVFAKRRDIPFLEGADRFAFSAALGATLVRLGNFFNSEIVGRKTDQTWGVAFPRFEERGEIVYRHPSQLYEMAIGIVTLGLLYVCDRAMGHEKRPRGALISFFFVFYFTGRFFVEFFKEYQVLNPETSPLTMGQYLSLPGFLIGVVGLVWAFQHRLPAGWKEEDVDDDEDDEDARDSNAGDPDVDAEFVGRKRGEAEEAEGNDDDEERDDDDVEKKAPEDDAAKGKKPDASKG